MKKLACPCCSDTFIADSYLERHIEKKHSVMLHGLPSSQFLFNMRNNKSTNYGQCIVCKSNTTFNLITKKYNRLCDNPKCKEEYVKTFKDRMKKKYGSEHLLNNPDKQKEMLAGRKISGQYKYGKKNMTYTGDYELDFLVFLNSILHFPEEDIISPAPMTFKYKYNNVEHFYIPDFYFPSMHLLVEIKASDNKHYRLRDIDQEKAKDKIAVDSGFNFLKIFDKDYTGFLEMIEDGKYIKPKKSSEKVLNEAMYAHSDNIDIGDVLLEESVLCERMKKETFIDRFMDSIEKKATLLLIEGDDYNSPSDVERSFEFVKDQNKSEGMYLPILNRIFTAEQQSDETAKITIWRSRSDPFDVTINHPFKDIKNFEKQFNIIEYNIFFNRIKAFDYKIRKSLVGPKEILFIPCNKIELSEFSQSPNQHMYKVKLIYCEAPEKS